MDCKFSTIKKYKSNDNKIGFKKELIVIPLNKKILGRNKNK